MDEESLELFDSRATFSANNSDLSPTIMNGETLKVALNLLSKVSRHEGVKWTKAPCPHEVAGCNFCGEELRKHDPECLIVVVDKFLKSLNRMYVSRPRT